MTLEEINLILQASGFPVAYHHFIDSENLPLPEPPFIVYLVAFSNNFMADNKVYKSIETVQIELYTGSKDLEAERKLEDILNLNSLPYQTTETFIDSEQLFQKIYEVRLF